MFDLCITGGSVWLEGGWRRATVCVEKDRFADVTDAVPAARETVDATGLFILPGLIDSHVHLCPPGAVGSSSDDFRTGSLAAIRGGTTTLIDFTGEATTPDEVDGLFHKRMADASVSLVDYAFHQSLTQPANVPEMVRRALGHGMPSFKMYTTYRIKSDDKHILELLKRSAAGDVMLNCHTENDALTYPEIQDMARFSQRRPELCELSEVAKLAEMTAYTGGLFYLVHVSCGETVELLKARFADLLDKRFILESCPHYFTLDDGVYQREDARLFTMTPPLRSPAQRQALCENLAAIRTLSTDHCPFLRAQKQVPLDAMPMGINGLGYSFAQMYRLFGDAVIDRFTKNQAATHGLKTKGSIAPGLDADLAIFQKQPPHPVEDLRGASDYSVYSAMEETLRFTQVLRRGEWLMRDGRLCETAGPGSYLPRSLI